MQIVMPSDVRPSGIVDSSNIEDNLRPLCTPLGRNRYLRIDPNSIYQFEV